MLANKIQNDYLLYYNTFWKILKFVSESKRKEYDFFYEKFLDHIIIDTEYLIKKYMPDRIDKRESQNPYKIEVFKRTFIKHTSGGNDKYYKQLLYPEMDLELQSKAKRIKRKNKMQKIIEIYGN